ncbi:hypothetical protein [Aureimonas mangrovi]|uniref:hypothetical protein n=1 Tax=Aureimonas mangrovi TaxID=2758041 RepID=UPI00163DA0F6|nr:hypothetical protein [Aureimonas mangrovi]
MNVVAFPPRARPHVVIESGRCTKSSDGTLIGRWVYMVDFIDEDGSVLHDYVGTDYTKAGRAAIEWARDYGCKIFDRSEEESGR